MYKCQEIAEGKGSVTTPTKSISEIKTIYGLFFVN